MGQTGTLTCQLTVQNLTSRRNPKPLIYPNISEASLHQTLRSCGLQDLQPGPISQTRRGRQLNVLSLNGSKGDYSTLQTEVHKRSHGLLSSPISLACQSRNCIRLHDILSPNPTDPHYSVPPPPPPRRLSFNHTRRSFTIRGRWRDVGWFKDTDVSSLGRERRTVRAIALAGFPAPTDLKQLPRQRFSFLSQALRFIMLPQDIHASARTGAHPGIWTLQKPQSPRTADDRAKRDPVHSPTACQHLNASGTSNSDISSPNRWYLPLAVVQTPHSSTPEN